MSFTPKFINLATAVNCRLVSAGRVLKATNYKELKIISLKIIFFFIKTRLNKNPTFPARKLAASEALQASCGHGAFLQIQFLVPVRRVPLGASSTYDSEDSRSWSVSDGASELMQATLRQEHRLHSEA